MPRGEFGYWQDCVKSHAMDQSVQDEYDLDEVIEQVLDRARDSVLIELEAALRETRQEILDEWREAEQEMLEEARQQEEGQA